MAIIVKHIFARECLIELLKKVCMSSRILNASMLNIFNDIEFWNTLSLGFKIFEIELITLIEVLMSFWQIFQRKLSWPVRATFYV